MKPACLCGRFFCLKVVHMSKTGGRDETRVHGGTLRSQYGETSEAIFLTQGFVYETSEAAEARFKGEDPASSTPAMAAPPMTC